MHNYCVILAGGGPQFWPVTREERPKAFHPVGADGTTLIQQTYQRALKLFPEEKILIVTPTRYGELVREQIPGIGADRLLLEP